MAFDIQSQPSLFLPNEGWIEWEQNNYWKKIDKIGNDFLERLDPRLEPRFYAYFSKICRERKNEV